MTNSPIKQKTMEKEKSKTLVVTNEVRFSYAHVHEAKQIAGKGDPKFSISLLIPKTDKVGILKLRAGIQAAFDEGVAKQWKGKKPPPGTWWDPLQDGDVVKADKPEYAGMMFVNAKSTTRPNIVDINKNEILDATKFYSGCFGRASISFFPYLNTGKYGVGAGLNNLQKLRDGEPFSGRTSAEDDFDDDFTTSYVDPEDI